MKVLVAGARGRLGSEVAREFRARGEVVALGRADLDITDDARVLKRITAESPDLIINCAAYNAVDAAQNDPVSALHVNAFGVRALARAAAAVDATLVHYGSDFVFDGRSNRPYVESDRPNPQSVYAMSKLLGEWFAADAPRHYVLRVESLFSQIGDGPATGSAATIVARLQSRRRGPRVRGSNRLADLRRRCRGRHRGHRRAQVAVRRVSLREFRPLHVVGIRRGSRAGDWQTRTIDADHARQRIPARASPEVLRAVERDTRRLRRDAAGLARRAAPGADGWSSCVRLRDLDGIEGWRSGFR